MKKIMLFLVVSAAAFFLSMRLTVAQEAAIPVKVLSEEVSVVNAGNKICPVSGEAVGQGGMSPVAYEYEGKIYNFCCAMCISSFKNDPQKYIKIVEEELKTENKAQVQGE